MNREQAKRALFFDNYGTKGTLRDLAELPIEEEAAQSVQLDDLMEVKAILLAGGYRVSKLMPFPVLPHNHPDVGPMQHVPPVNSGGLIEAAQALKICV